MLELAAVKKGDTVCDLGSGDGRIVIAAARTYGCRAIGYELNEELVLASRKQAKLDEVASLASFEQKDIFKVDLSMVDVATLYLLPRQNAALIPRLNNMKPGSRIVAHEYAIPGVKESRKVSIKSADSNESHTLYLYTTPLNEETNSAPHPVTNPGSARMLKLPGKTSGAGTIDFANLPRLGSEHAVISDVRNRGGKWVNQHAYLVHHDGRYWAMWSDGPGVPKVPPQRHRDVVPGHDQPGTRVSYATSEDGLKWSKTEDLSGPPRRSGFGWIARGFWVRDGELLALASHFNAPGYTGEGLSLEAFRWDKKSAKWTAHGTVLDNALNNFPPKKLPSGEWMMSRRDYRKQVSVMLGGVKAFNQWEVRPLAKYEGKQMPEEPYWYVLPDGKNLVGLLRDNSGSKRLLRTFSADNGRNWSSIVRTNFPDAKSKFFALRTSRGYYALVSNANPRRRDPLTLAISRDGLVYHRLFYLVGGRHVDYPNMIEHEGALLISFSSAKQTVEVLKVPLATLDAMIEQGPKIE
jgi:hypothetical protein